MATVVVHQPDDAFYIGVSEDNPYKNQDDSQQPHTVYFGERVFHLPIDVILRATELERAATTLRYVCGFDVVLTLVNFFITGYVPLLVASFFNYVGYIGAKKFSRMCIYVYIFYQITNSLFKIGYITGNAHVIPVEVSVVVGISAAFNLMITWLAHSLVRMIPT